MNIRFKHIHTLLQNTHKMEKGKKLEIEDMTSKDEKGHLLSRFYKMNEIVHTKTENLDYQTHNDDLTTQ